jgi:NAD(P)-dependent dehydrogenase (short-subunit alcohol dehydrogenase family)
MKTALITGASRGLGLALAQQLAGAGWSLIIDARGGEALEAARADLAKSTQVVAIAGDITDGVHRHHLAEAAGSLGGLDAVINNASILGPSPQPHLLDYPLETLEQVYHANVIAPLGLLQAVRQHLKPGAHIINVTSDAGVEPYAGWGGYGSSKAALEHLTAIFAAENPSFKVYWVDPGDMRTQMHQEAFPNEDIGDRPLSEISVPGFVALLEGEYPSGRYKARAVSVTPSEPQPERMIQEFRVVLKVEDFAKATAFYRDGLNLPTILEWTNPDGRGVILDAGRSTLELLDRPQAEAVDRVEVSRQVTGPVRLAFQVADVEAASKVLIERGAEALHAIVDTPWGDRNQRLQASDGMQITLFKVPDIQ